jgi:O-antigen/teichoic acid export membrane protein
LDTAWTILVGQGCINALVLLLLAESISVFFGEPGATPLIQVYSIALLLNGFVNIGVVYFQKELEFHKQFVFVLLEVVVSVCITLSVALLTRSVWALVLGALGGMLARVISSFLLHQYRPRFKFDWLRFRELFAFGSWIWLSSIIFFFQSQGDNLIVGRILGTAVLGFYRVAYSMANLAGTEVGNILGRIMLPVYANLQDDPINLKAAYLKHTRMQTSIILPLAVGMVMLAPDLVRVVLGEMWLPVGTVLQILVGFSVLNAMVRRAEVLLEAKGFPKHGTIGRGLFLLVGGILIYPLALSLKLPGVALAVVAGISAGWLYVEYQAAKHLALTVIELTKAYAANFFAAGGMGLILFALGPSCRHRIAYCSLWCWQQ